MHLHRVVQSLPALQTEPVCRGVICPALPAKHASNSNTRKEVDLSLSAHSNRHSLQKTYNSPTGRTLRWKDEAVHPLEVDPEHYKLEFENDSVRVLRISYGPGEKSVMHYHPAATIVYISDASTRMTTPDGKSQDMTGKAGAVAATPAGSHMPQNIGTKYFEAILIEQKK